MHDASAIDYRPPLLAVPAALILLFGLLIAGLPQMASAQESPHAKRGTAINDYIFFHDLTAPCTGECGVHIYTGRFLNTSMRSVFGIDPITPIWNWDWLDSGILAVALSRPVVSFRDKAEIELEVGVAKRFGQLKSAEAWAALFVRWKYFPWNKYLRTSIGVSTGLNYAFSNDFQEVVRTDTSGGSKLLHFLTPEIAFSLPEYPNAELVFRLHHRSGSRGFLIGNTGIFKGASGGAQYGTVGMRFRF